MLCRICSFSCECCGKIYGLPGCRSCGGTGRLNGPSPSDSPTLDNIDAVMRACAADEAREEWLRLLVDEGGEG